MKRLPRSRACGRWRSVRLPRVLGLVLLLGLAGCADRIGRDRFAAHVAGGDPRLGRQLVRSYGCVDCHVIPGVRGANARVGPPLTHWARRAYIAGLVPNVPENLVAWLVDPQQIHPQTAMPNTGLTPDQARDIAAYLYTLR